MIRYTLQCENDHQFEGWYASADAFESVRASKMVECPTCGSTEVAKSLMAPTVRPARAKAQAPAAPASNQPMASPGDAKMAEALKQLKEHVEKNSEYVGTEFAAEARAMHEGDTPERSIYGEANREDARKLAEDGIPAVPLPFIPKQKTN